jgi:hypothetical protein
MPQGIGYQPNRPGRGRRPQWRRGPQWRPGRPRPGQQQGGGAVAPGLPPLPASPPQVPNQGLPLDPMFEQGRRSLDDILSANLSRIGAARGQIQPFGDLSLARMRTAQTEDERRTREGANARGIFGSSIMGRDLGTVGEGYGRQRQDLGLEMGRQFQGLADEESQARLGYQQGLQELLMQLAGQTAQDPSAPIYGQAPYQETYRDIPNPPAFQFGFGGRRGGRGGGGGGRRGGGGGGGGGRRRR